MTIKERYPYKISLNRAKRYAAHYNINPERCLIVPLRIFGSEASCDIRWEDDNGELHHLQNKFFVIDNLVPLNAMLEPNLADLWKHYYDSDLTVTPPQSRADHETNAN